MRIGDLLRLAASAAQPEVTDVGPVDDATIVSPAVAPLTQLLTEIVDNAEKHSDGDIVLTGTADDGGYILTVTDGGPGMSPEQVTKANRALVMVDRQEAPRNGYEVVGMLADKLGASVVVRSTRVGTTVRVYVPLSLLEGTPEPEANPAEVVEEVATSVGESTATGEDTAWPTLSILSYTPEEAAAAEEFLAGVFMQLLPQEAQAELVTETPTEMPDNVTTLRVRVPGTSFTGDEGPRDVVDKAASPYEIRTALSSFEDGRKAALEAQFDDDETT